MECCSNGVGAASQSATSTCPICGEVGRIVEKQTIVHQVKSEKLSSVTDRKYRFCDVANCDTVYYSANGSLFTTDDVRELITSKINGDDRPLCYCFGFTEGTVRREIILKGEATVSTQVTHFIKENLCACDIRNPAGSCCLGEIKRTEKQILAEVAAITR